MEDNVSPPEEKRAKQDAVPMFTNIAAIKKALADRGYSDKFTITFSGQSIAEGCAVVIKDTRQNPIGRARTCVPGRPIIDQQSGSVYLEVFFSGLQIFDGPETEFVISVEK